MLDRLLMVGGAPAYRTHLLVRYAARSVLCNLVARLDGAHPAGWRFPAKEGIVR